ncbi:MAG: T9SS type A sorting domain-containing protein [Bacteroidota bacterium]
MSFVFISQFSVAQKEDRNWVFGDSVGIDFNNLANPTVFSSNSLGFEACSSISNSVGNIICYSSSFDPFNSISLGKIINRNNELMENGDSIHLCFTAADGGLFIPFPSDTNKYYFFSIGINESTNIEYLNYSVIDLNFNSGFGKVTSKNYLLADSTTEHLIAIKHGNGRDWWLLTKKILSNKILKFLITEQGISGPYEQQIGSIPFSELGESAETRGGNKIAFVTYFGNIDLFDFDRCSGTLSNYIELGTPPYDVPDSLDWGYYGCEFSADGNRLYTTKIKSNSPLYTNIFQYSLNNTQVTNSKTEILPSIAGYFLGQLRLAPDNKIYIAGEEGPGVLDSSYKYLSVIESPNDSGLACSLNLFSLYLNGRSSFFGLPNMPNYNLGKLVGSPCDTLTSIQNENLKTKSSVRIFPNPATEQLTIELLRQAQHDSNQFEIEITDVMGRIIYKEQSYSHLSIIHCQLFSAGIYFVKVYMNDGIVEVRKFVKEQQ